MDSDIAIVGYGPVGAVLGGLLAQRGFATTVFDRDVDIFGLPRAAHLDHEILRVLQGLGCADEAAAAMRENVGMDFVDAQRRPLLSFRSPGVTSGGWPASMLFHQPAFEATLRAAAVRLGVDTRLGVGVDALRSDDDGVELTLADGARHRARWVIGCDGARSTVRRALGVTMHDLEFEEPWLVVDLILRAPIAELPDFAVQVCDPARPSTLVPMPAPRFRFEFMLLAGEDPDAMQDPAVVRKLVAGWVDPELVTVERSAVYTFHGVVARTWRGGRQLLAGDAAHQMPPFLGQGMCAGIRDAANLAWKLELVDRHGFADSLLDTYQREREPHVRAIVDSAVSFGRMICTTDVDVAAARDAHFLATPVVASETPDAVPPLRGPLVAEGRGHPVAQPADIGGQRFDDVVGTRFAIVTRSPVADLTFPAPFCALDAATHPALGPWLDGLATDMAIVRPDRYLLGDAHHLLTHRVPRFQAYA